MAKRAPTPSDLVHSDAVGAMNVDSSGDAIYFVTLYDDYSFLSSARFLKKKSEIPGAREEMILEAEIATRGKVRRIRFHNAKKYKKYNREQFTNWLIDTPPSIH